MSARVLNRWGVVYCASPKATAHRLYTASYRTKGDADAVRKVLAGGGRRAAAVVPLRIEYEAPRRPKATT